MKKEIGVNGLVIKLRKEKGEEFISLTDIARKIILLNQRMS